MLRIALDDYEMDIGKVSMQLTLNSQYSFFKQDNSFSYNFFLPDTPRNNFFFQHKNKIHKPVDEENTYTFQSWFNTTSLFSGQGVLVKATNKGYEVIVGLAGGSLFVDIKDKLMQELKYGGKINFASNTWPAWLQEMLDLGTDDDYEIFRVGPHANNFLSSTLGMDNWHHQNNLGIDNANVLYWKTNYPSGPKIEFATPFLRQNWVLKKLFEEFNYTLKFNYLSTVPEYDTITYYNNRCLDGKFQYADTVFFMEPNEHVPKMTVEEYLISLQNYLNVTPFINHSTREVYLVDNNAFLKNQKPAKEFDSLVSEDYEIEIEAERGGTLKLNYIDGVAVNVKGKYTDKLPVPIQEYSSTGVVPSPVEGQIVRLFNLQYWIYRRINPDLPPLDWFKHDPNEADLPAMSLNEYRFGSDPSANTWESKAGFALMDIRDFYNETRGIGPGATDGARMPVVEINLNHEDYPDYQAECPMLLMMYRGMTFTDLSAVDTDSFYPYFSNDTSNSYEDNYSAWDLSLKLNNDEMLPDSGIISQRWTPHFNWLLTRKKQITRRKFLNEVEFSELDFNEPYRVDQANYMIRSIQVNVDWDKISIAELKLWKL